MSGESSDPPRGDWLGAGVKRAGWAPLSLFTFHMVAMLELGLYQRYSRLDDVMHVIGGVVIAWFFLTVWRAAIATGVAGRPAPALTPLLVLSLTAFAAMGWEVAEYVLDHLMGTHLQKSLDDTMSDMMYGLLGGALLVALSRRARQPVPRAASAAREAL